MTLICIKIVLLRMLIYVLREYFCFISKVFPYLLHFLFDLDSETYPNMSLVQLNLDVFWQHLIWYEKVQSCRMHCERIASYKKDLLGHVRDEDFELIELCNQFAVEWFHRETVRQLQALESFRVPNLQWKGVIEKRKLKY